MPLIKSIIFTFSLLLININSEEISFTKSNQVFDGPIDCLIPLNDEEIACAHSFGNVIKIRDISALKVHFELKSHIGKIKSLVKLDEEILVSASLDIVR